MCVLITETPNFFIGLGYLTIETLKGILLELEPNLGDEQLMEIVEEVDEDGSGTIDFDGNKIDVLFVISNLIIYFTIKCYLDHCQFYNHSFFYRIYGNDDGINMKTPNILYDIYECTVTPRCKKLKVFRC